MCSFYIKKDCKCEKSNTTCIDTAWESETYLISVLTWKGGTCSFLENEVVAICQMSLHQASNGYRLKLQHI